MTLKIRILDALQAEQDGLTYNQLAYRLEANEPSVRRTTKGLQNAGLVRFVRYADASGTDMVWGKV